MRNKDVILRLQLLRAEYSSEQLDTYFIAPLCRSFSFIANKDHFFVRSHWKMCGVVLAAFDGQVFENTDFFFLTASKFKVNSLLMNISQYSN